jgi:hypothetical protein
MTGLEEVMKRQNDFLRKIGGPGALRETDSEYNDINRELISAFKDHHGKAYLGSINFYNAERTAVANGEKSVYEEYVGQMIYNFHCAFCVPAPDEELEEMIRRWNGAGDSSGVAPYVVKAETIANKIEAVGGINLIWC